MFRTLFRFRRAPRPAAPPPALPAETPAEDIAGCGWFDSSADLRHGLLVTELPVAEFVYGRRGRLQSGNGLARH